jgi:hypothetical protein
MINGGFEMNSKELKAKVMTLGNKLAPRMGGDRRAAFVEAWAIVKKGAVEVKAVGTSFGRRPEALRRLAHYDPSAIRAIAVPEPENLKDPHAIAILVGVNGGRGLFKIGYVPASMTAPVSVLRTLPAVRVVGDTVKGFRLRFTV